MAILPVGIGSAEEGGYEIERSLRFNSADSTSLNRTPGSASNRRTWTWSGWVKRCEISDTERVFFSAGADANNFTALEWINSKLYLQNYTSGVQTITNTTDVFRDASAWYHIVLAIDTTQATSANRAKIYVNGVQQAGFSGSPFSLNQEFWINYTYSHRIGARQLSSADAFSNQYMAEVHFIDGSALDPTSFGEFNEDTGVWQPKAYSGSYGTNGFYLNFSDNASTTTLGEDQAGSNDWTTNNFSVTAGAGNDSLVDTPTNYGTDTGVGGEVRGNYCTWNPLQNAGALSISNGNLDIASKAFNANAIGTLGATSGKWYYEAILGNRYGSYQIIGVVTSDIAQAVTNSIPYNRANSIVWLQMENVYVETTAYATTNYYDSTVRTVSVAFDLDNWKFHVRMDGGAWQNSGDPAAGTGGYDIPVGMRGKLFLPIAGPNNVGADPYIYANFGQRPFSYAAATGFKALCTQNLPESEATIPNGGEYFDVDVYTGIAGTYTKSGLDFQPDFIWGKARNAAAAHRLVDAVRGGTLKLTTSSTAVENTDVAPYTFTSDGYSIPGGVNHNNSNGTTYVSWLWKANGAGVSNTDGTITSTVSANTTSGISICTYTGNLTAGATVGHGLGVAPAMIIVKDRDGVYDWYVYHDALAVTNVLRLSDITGAYADTQFNQQDPTSSIFYLGNNVASNTSGHRYVAYCFAAIPGYSAFGSYTGSTTKVFVYLGFRPAFVLLKKSSEASTTFGWPIVDNSRPFNTTTYEGYNPTLELWADAATGELSSTSNYSIDLLSNGFCINVANNANVSGSGKTYIYAAFAENPFKYSLAR